MGHPLHEIAHISHAELLTPTPDESLGFFVDVLGMEIEAREVQSVFLRGWGDYQRYCLKLTESDSSGLGHMALQYAKIQDPLVRGPGHGRISGASHREAQVLLPFRQ